MRSRARRFAYRNIGGRAIVLMYHRVADLDRDPQLLAVGPESFDAHMRMLSDRYRVVPLADLVADLSRHTVRDRSVAVTFDDGYADNLTAAAPVLAKHGVPATVFVSSGYAGGGREFWWDEVERLVLSPGTLPARLDLATSQACFSAGTEGAAVYTVQDAEQDAAWDVTQPDPGERQRLYRELCAFLRPLPSSERESALEQLRAASGAQDVVRETHRPLSPEEVRELDASLFVEVGGHTSSHVVLSAQTVGGQREEIEADRRRLAELTGREPRLFSYPFGGSADYGDEAVALLGEVGYAGACSNHEGVVKPWTDRYRIPRHIARDGDAEALRRRIEDWFDEPR